MKYLLRILIVLLCSQNGFSQIRLPRLVSDGMVLQRDAKVKIWGYASPGETVQIAFQDYQETTEADSSGEWNFQFDDLKIGGPFNMDLIGKNHI